MSIEKRRLIDIDVIQRRLTLPQVAAHYNFTLPADMGTSGEQRMSCPCDECAGSKDNKSVSINLSDEFKRWKCHREGYGCGASGRLAMLAYCMKHGHMPPSGKLNGEHFWEIAEELRDLADGKPVEPNSVVRPTIEARQDQARQQISEVVEPARNVPLAESANENARNLVKLDAKMVRQLEDLSPAASRYARQRPFLLNTELAQEIRTGYMPGNSKSSLRHNWVFGVMDRMKRPLAWIGRNVRYEEQHHEWIQKGRHGKEPAKYRFPNQTLFLRGQELYGQEWLDDERFGESLKKYGVILVEGFTDRIRLHELGVLSLAMMSNKLTDEQTALLVQHAREKGNNRVGIMHDADSPGDEGAKETLWRLQQEKVQAYLVWSMQMHDGKFRGRQPESLSEREWQELATHSEHQ